MATPAIQVDGLNELRRDLRRIEDDGLNDALKTANRNIAKEIVDRVLPNVPVGETGRLKKSVRGLGNLAGAVGKAGSSLVDYAAAIHWGRSSGNTNFKTGKYSRGQSALGGRPFLVDAAKQVENDVTDRYMDEIDEVLDLVNAARSRS